MENKNFFLAIALSISFLCFWTLVVVPRFTPKTPASAPLPAPTQTSGTSTMTTTTSVQPTASSVAVEKTMEDAQNKITFSSLGGGVRSWVLKMKGQPIEMVLDQNGSVLTDAPDALFQIKTDARQAVLSTQLQNGLRFSKTLSLTETGFLHDLTFRFENPTNKTIDVTNWSWGWGPGVGTAVTEHKDNANLIRALNFEKYGSKAVKEGDYPAVGQWAGIDNRYFLVAFLPPGDNHPALRVTGAKGQTVIALHESLTVPPHGSVVLPYKIYVGPKGYTQLRHYGKNLEEAVDFGFFSFFGKLILRALYGLKELTNNYGWAIVLLTVILQILITPLTYKSFKSMMAMKKMQPQIAALQAKYKNDPKRLNVETLHLYKTSGANPLGGCLPLLLQIPIFWALYTTLRNAYELRGAPFIGWLHDLSAPDRLHILPIAWAGGMFLQQRMSGAATDPTQRQMAYMMPAMFLFMGWSFPAGLLVYMVTSNIMTMLIQWNMQRHHADKPSRPDVIDAKIVR